MKTKEKVADYLFNCGVSHEDYITVKPHLVYENYRVWRLTSLFAGIVFTALFILSLTYEKMHMPDVYVVRAIGFSTSAAVFLLVGILLMTCVNTKHPLLLTLLTNFVGVYHLTMSIVVFYFDYSFSVLVIGSLMCLPFLYLDKPYKNIMFESIFVLAYVIVSLSKSGDVDRYSVLISSISLGVIATTISSFVNYRRVNNLVLKLRYEKQRSIDSLTKVNNKTAYDYRVEVINKKLRVEDIAFAVVVFDINRLKETNDTYGHKFGDELIVRSVNLIQEVFKTKIYRIGGDEFVCILFDEDYEHTEYLIQNFRLKVEIIHKSATSLKRDTSIACGYSKCIPSDREFVDVFVRADNDMYLDKEKIKSKLKEEVTEVINQE